MKTALSGLRVKIAINVLFGLLVFASAHMIYFAIEHRLYCGY